MHLNELQARVFLMSNQDLTDLALKIDDLIDVDNCDSVMYFVYVYKDILRRNITYGDASAQVYNKLGWLYLMLDPRDLDSAHYYLSVAIGYIESNKNKTKRVLNNLAIAYSNMAAVYLGKYTKTKDPYYLYETKIAAQNALSLDSKGYQAHCVLYDVYARLGITELEHKQLEIIKSLQI